MSSKVPRPTVEVGWASISVYVDFFSRPSCRANVHSTGPIEGFIGPEHVWILVGIHKKVKFCCRGRFLPSAKMELILLWHLDPAPKWNFEAKWNFAAKGHLKFDFGAGDIPFWQKIRFWHRIQLP